ncbi:hypothetical protein NEFER03_1975 [Nematocida sp. LUAm3]|nr:hypothetical protein NEFER03_1975 [Nematocida sp. LUAm3]KAI5176059.1 hypothetical protein NEFER02_1893 [Nematocida sp. LUAm2]KAI5177103.1 hypothetical protein NEFER01_0378 [Nematocida sp. LUAm1]
MKKKYIIIITAAILVIIIGSIVGYMLLTRKDMSVSSKPYEMSEESKAIVLEKHKPDMAHVNESIKKYCSDFNRYMARVDFMEIYTYVTVDMITVDDQEEKYIIDFYAISEMGFLNVCLPRSESNKKKNELELANISLLHSTLEIRVNHIMITFQLTDNVNADQEVISAVDSNILYALLSKIRGCDSIAFYRMVEIKTNALYTGLLNVDQNKILHKSLSNTKIDILFIEHLPSIKTIMDNVCTKYKSSIMHINYITLYSKKSELINIMKNYKDWKESPYIYKGEEMARADSVIKRIYYPIN